MANEIRQLEASVTDEDAPEGAMVYVKLAAGTTFRSIEASPWVFIEVDEAGKPTGIQLIGVPLSNPRSEAPPPPPCPECERLRRVADGWQKQADDERRMACALEERIAKHDDELAALGSKVAIREKERDAALAEVERVKANLAAETAALLKAEAERDEARKDASFFRAARDECSAWHEEAIKARDAALAERDRWRETAKSAEGEADRQRERANLAESALATAQARDEEVRRLRKALEEISGMGERFDAKGTHSRRVCEIARAALGSPR